MTTAAAIRTALQCADRRCACSRGRATHCPGHDDARPSLAVDEREARVLVFCRAGCTQRDVIDALRAHGLWSSGPAKATRATTRGRTTHELALDLVRSQPWTRPGVREVYRAADVYRRTMHRVHAMRAATAEAGDTPSGWELLARATAIETAAFALEAQLDENILSIVGG